MTTDAGGLDDARLLRYSRHILLDELGVEAQEKLLAARVLVIGVGGLGNPAALYLATAGVGHITLVDGDQVDLTNLQRQLLFAQDDIGKPKVQRAAADLRRRNPDVEIEAIELRADHERLMALVAKADVVLDCSDNFATRHALNRACSQFGKPLISGAAIRFDGQLSVFDLRDHEAGCYACLFADTASGEEDNCATMGVFAPLTGMIGMMQAGEAIKILTGAGETLSGKLLMIDALNSRFQTVQFGRDPQCSVCATRALRTATA